MFKQIEVMCLKTLSECVENLLYSVFLKKYDAYIKDFGDDFMMQIPVDETIKYNQSSYFVIGTFEVLGYLHYNTPICENVYFDIGLFDPNGDEINTILNETTICVKLRKLIQEIFNN